LRLRPSSANEIRPATPLQRALVWATAAVLLLLLIAPLVALAWRSFAPGDPLRYYRELFVNRTNSLFYVAPGAAIRNSVIFAMITTVLALALGSLTAALMSGKSRRGALLLEPLVLLPLGASAVTLGFGYILTMGRPPLDLRASPVLVPIVHTLVAFPFVVRTLLPVMRGINPDWREAAAILGGSPATIWREIDLPIIGRALLVAALFAFTVSMGEFGATLLIARPEFPTMPLVIYRLLGQPGALNYGQALAMSALLMLVCAVAFALIERFRVGQVGEF
jgi:thiamine transport system permease protein